MEETEQKDRNVVLFYKKIKNFVQNGIFLLVLPLRKTLLGGIETISRGNSPFYEEMQVFEKEMHDFKEEMHDFKEKMHRFRKECTFRNLTAKRNVFKFFRFIIQVL